MSWFFKHLTEQLYSSGQAINIDKGPEGLCCAHPAEEQHRTGAIDAVEDSALLVHPKGNNVSLIGELLRQCLGPKSTLGYQVGAGILGQVVWVYSGGVFGGEAQAQSSAPAALLFSNLGKEPDVVDVI